MEIKSPLFAAKRFIQFWRVSDAAERNILTSRFFHQRVAVMGKYTKEVGKNAGTHVMKFLTRVAVMDKYTKEG